jgi:putative glutamine amidotransferase
MKTMHLPVIGISASLLTIEKGCLLGRERSFVGHDYIRAVQQSGGVPLVLPIISDESVILQQLELIDGLLLSGGYDVQPVFYGEEPLPLLEEICPQRDVYEMALIKGAHQAGKPILGVCRGLQLLNVAFGGTLYQDLSQHSVSVLQHSQKAKVEVATHTVDIMDSTLLRDVFNQSNLRTNSFHHQAVKQLAPGFRANAKASDGIIEGIEKEDAFVLGVQWHPELMFEQHPCMLRLFQAFVEAAHKRRHR